MRVILLVNPIAGRGRAPGLVHELTNELRRRGCWIETIASRPDTERHTQIIRGGFDAAAVIGGDGTLHQWLPALVAANVPVWHAPLGTENLFAREHGMTADPVLAARSIYQRRVANRDIGAANGTPFAIMASFGPDAAIVSAVNANRQGGISHLSYAGPTVRELFSTRVARGHLTIDGIDQGPFTGMILVAVMSAYGAKLDPAWNARHDDGLLDVVVLPGHRAAAVGARLMACWTREPTLIPGRRSWQGRSIDICFDKCVAKESERALADAQIDGDPSNTAISADGLARIESLPGALRVILPSI